MRIFTIILTMVVTGCGIAAPAHYEGCPPLKQYSADSNVKFAAIFPALPQEAQNRLTDYRELRKECGQP